MIPGRTCFIILFGLILSAPSVSGLSAEEELFIATPLTGKGSFTRGIEGPACDASGNIYAVNFAQDQSIGLITSEGKGSVFFTLPGESIGNGIRFLNKNLMYVADYKEHKVWQIALDSKEAKIHAHHEKMNQPNDLAITADGVLFASDPNWGESTGQIWRIDPDGSVQLAAGGLGTTNGIEVSPDGTKLYVNESVQLNVWEFTITSDKQLIGKRLLKKFDAHGFDGMRCDIDGNLYISRYGKGTVAKLSPAGELLQEIDVLGARPSNVCFGGPDGRTIYVTEVEHQRLVQFRVDRPGLSWKRFQDQEK